LKTIFYRKSCFDTYKLCSKSCYNTSKPSFGAIPFVYNNIHAGCTTGVRGGRHDRVGRGRLALFYSLLLIVQSILTLFFIANRVINTSKPWFDTSESCLKTSKSCFNTSNSRQGFAGGDMIGSVTTASRAFVCPSCRATQVTRVWGLWCRSFVHSLSLSHSHTLGS